MVQSRERESLIDNLLAQIRFMMVMISWTGLAPWEFECLIHGVPFASRLPFRIFIEHTGPRGTARSCTESEAGLCQTLESAAHRDKSRGWNVSKQKWII
jgi:hypothetical protein